MKLLYRRNEEDLGNGQCTFTWRPTGNIVAVAGSNQSIALLDKKGDIIDQLDMPGKVLGMAWDKEGDLLAIICEKSTNLTLWDYNTKEPIIVDTNMGSKEFPCCVAWSPTSPLLAVGVSGGNLYIYNHQTARKFPILGKHQRKITEVVFAKDDIIVCISEDNNISLSTPDGDTISTCVANDPKCLKICEMKRTGSSQSDTSISVIADKKYIQLTSLGSPDTSLNLQFQERYGNIAAYDWFNSGYLLLAFEKGSIVGISCHPSEIGSEIFSVTDFKTYVSDVMVSAAFGRALIIGDHQLRVRDINNLTDMVEIVDVETEKDLCQVSCSPDGTMVGVASKSGSLSMFLTKMPTMGAAYLDTVAVLTSLSQISIMPEGDKSRQYVVNIAVEPSVIGVGPRHIGVASNNRVWFYDFTVNGNKKEVSENQIVSLAEYLSTVLEIQLNDTFAAIVMEGKVRLHKIIESEYDKSMTFPEASRNAKLLSAALTQHFLIFSTDTNYIVYFSLDEWAIVSEYRHTSPFKKVFPDTDAIKCCLLDERLDSWVYSPVDDSMHKLPAVGSTVHYKAAHWESFTIDRGTFIVYDNTNIHVFLLSKSQIDGSTIQYVGATKLPYGHIPLMLSKGIVHCMTANAKTTGVLLDSHRTDTVLKDKDVTLVQSLLAQALVLRRWAYSWRICEHTQDLTNWNNLAKAALLSSNVQLAFRVFRHIGDVSMVESLEKILPIEEKALMAGQIAALLGSFDQAESLFLSSSQPLEALMMRWDLLDWPRALILAEKLNKDKIPQISRQYAQELEFMGDYPNALAHYENGVLEKYEEETEAISEMNEICRSGIARMSIRTGDIRRGVQMARQLEGRVVKKECALALEQLKQYSEAAELYELGQYYDRAAAVCLKAKAWGKVGQLLPKVRSPKIHAQYGRIMEGEKKYKQACIAYRNARDYDNLVRLLLDQLKLPEEAVQVVRESRSVEGAKHVARFFASIGEFSSAIQFLVMSQCHQEAFQLAETNDRMMDYAAEIEKDGTIEQYSQLAEHFSGLGDAYNAGKFYCKAGQYGASLDHLLAIPSESAIMQAIECVKLAEDKILTDKLIDFLLGGVDGIPKDTKHLFSLYVAIGKIREAAKTAVLIAREEQEKGHYTISKKLLFAMHQELNRQNINIPQDMQNSLMLIHSYLIVKALIKRSEFTRASRMLIRVTQSISKFPTHTVEILTSTVVICSRAGLKAAALQAAIALMQPAYRSKIATKYKKKIESIVRKSEKTTDNEENKTPCPVCKAALSESELSCSKCKNNIPYCIVTGIHITENDFATCPNCNFPGFYSELKKLVQLDEDCPMCEGSLKDVIPGDANAYLKKGSDTE